jgi:DNA-binding transcriptional LysR family regulator
LVLTGEVGFGYIVLPRGESSTSEKLLRREILSERPAALFLPPNHPLETKRRLTLADLTRHPLILPGSDSLWRQRIDQVFRDAGLLERRQILLEVTTTYAARRYSSLGLAPSLFPLPYDALKFPRLQVRLVDELLPSEEVVFIYPRIGRLRPQAQLFIDFVRDRVTHERL